MCKKMMFIVSFILLAEATVQSAYTEPSLLIQTMVEPVLFSSIDAPVCWWKFDGNFADSSGNGHHGSPTGGPSFAQGQLGQAVNLNPASINNQYINCGPACNFSTIGDGGTADGVTILVWIKRYTVGGTQKICSCFKTTTPGAGFVLSIRSINSLDQIIWDLCDSKGSYSVTARTGTELQADTWYHIAVVLDDVGSTCTVYINGEVIEKWNVNNRHLLASDGEFRIGTSTPYISSSVFKGLMDDLCIYDTPLTQNEIRAMMFGAELACCPSPANGAIEVPRDADISWKPGLFAVKHNVYLGTDVNDVNDATVADPCGVLVSQNQADATYIPTSLLDYGKIYYWRVDEVNDLELDSPWKGKVWSFTTIDFTIVDDFEGYNDSNNQIRNTWRGYTYNNTGMTVGHLDPPFAETSIVHSGRQSMYMRYDNDGTVNEGTSFVKDGTKFYSEAERQWADAQDWTKDGAASLSIWFRGLVAPGSFTAGPPVYRMTAAGADIYGNADQFQYAYKRLSGNGSIKAKVLSLTNTNAWAKAGVMIRETLAANSKHADVVISPTSGVDFQRRTTSAPNSERTTVAGVAAPQWVRLTRSGNTFTAEYSANGTSWLTLGTPLDMPMLPDVYIGLCLTSHNTGATCVAEFSDVTTTGTVTGQWQSQDIGIKSNVTEGLYVVVSDSAGNSAVVKNTDPAAANLTAWTEWNIPFTDLAGANMQAIKKLSIGVGDRVNPQRGGAGDLYIDDIRLYLPSP